MNSHVVDSERFADLIDKELVLDCLHEAGVNEWEGYEQAMEEYYRRKRGGRYDC